MVPKIGNRCSNSPISRFRSYDENVGRSFVVCSHDPILRIRFLVPKIGNRRSNGPTSRFRFCGENIGRSFVVSSRDPIFRNNKESLIWRQNDHRGVMQNLLAPFIFQEECRMKIEHVLFPSDFSKLRIRVLEGHF